MTDAEKAEDRIPDIETAMRCVKSLLEYHRFDDDEHLYRDDLRVSISRIETALKAQEKPVEVTEREFEQRFGKISGYKRGVVKTIRHWLRKEFPNGLIIKE